MLFQRNKTAGAPLWTRDFTILTVGSAISLFGNAMSGFATGLLVLDYTGSSFLFAVFLAVYTLPQILAPMVSGAILDRFSRRKTIYSLDFISAGLYGISAFLLSRGWFSFPFLAFLAFAVGCITSIYKVAYQSFYPLLIPRGNFSKAYSVSGVLEALSAIMIPISTFLYKQLGSMAPILAANSVFFLAAAIVETRIRAEETYIVTQQKLLGEQAALEAKPAGSVKVFWRDFKEGIAYLRREKGLMAITVYFIFNAIAYASSGVVVLPYFKRAYPPNGEYWYMIVVGMAVVGTVLGGLIQYRVKIPARWKFGACVFVYVFTAFMEGFYPWAPIPLAMGMCLLSGLFGSVSTNIRVASTQSYVPDEKKGRFNGAYNTLFTTGSLVGQLLTGVLVLRWDDRWVLTGFMMLAALAGVLAVGCNPKAVKPIVNRDQ